MRLLTINIDVPDAVVERFRAFVVRYVPEVVTMAIAVAPSETPPEVAVESTPAPTNTGEPAAETITASVLETIRKLGLARSREIADKLGITLRPIQNALARLRGRGLIESVGMTNKAKWQLVKSTTSKPEPVKPPPSPKPIPPPPLTKSPPVGPPRTKTAFEGSCEKVLAAMAELYAEGQRTATADEILIRAKLGKAGRGTTYNARLLKHLSASNRIFPAGGVNLWVTNLPSEPRAALPAINGQLTKLLADVLRIATRPLNAPELAEAIDATLVDVEEQLVGLCHAGVAAMDAQSRYYYVEVTL